MSLRFPCEGSPFCTCALHLLVGTGPTPAQPAGISTADGHLARLQQSLVVGLALVVTVSTGTNTLLDIDIFIRGND